MRAKTQRAGLPSCGLRSMPSACMAATAASTSSGRDLGSCDCESSQFLIAKSCATGFCLYLICRSHYRTPCLRQRQPSSICADAPNQIPHSPVPWPGIAFAMCCASRTAIARQIAGDFRCYARALCVLNVHITFALIVHGAPKDLAGLDVNVFNPWLSGNIRHASS